MLARHHTLKPTARFLHTSATVAAASDLTNPSPIPLSGPSSDKKPLYFASAYIERADDEIPKILLDEQQSLLDRQIRHIDDLIRQEQADMADERVRVRENCARDRLRIAELQEQLFKYNQAKTHL